MSDKWVVDEDYPSGHLVAMTPGEEAQLRKDRAAGARADAAQAAAEEQAAARIIGLRKAQSDLADGVIFASLSAREKNVLDMLIETGQVR